MPTPLKSAAALIRLSTKQQGGEVYRIGDELYIHAPFAPASKCSSHWPHDIIVQQLKQIKFSEFSDKIDATDKINNRIHNADARKARKIIWGLIFNSISGKFKNIKFKRHNGLNREYKFYYKDANDCKIHFSIEAEKFSRNNPCEAGILTKKIPPPHNTYKMAIGYQVKNHVLCTYFFK